MSSVISNFGAESSVASADNGFLGIGSVSGINRMVPTMAFKVSRRFENGVFHISRLCLSHSTKAAKGSKIGMTLVDERIAHGRDVRPSDILAYDLVQGAHVRWSYIMDKSVPDPPTAVLLHGILGSRKNWGTFARRLAQEFPTWQDRMSKKQIEISGRVGDLYMFLLVDLRCHGDSTAIKKRGPHTVASAALDILKLLGQLRLTPRVVVGHSFGGKVALSMLDQTPKPLARPVRVWVLDATPGKVRAGGDGDDRPFELISFLRTLPKEVASKKDLVDSLVREGFSKDVAQWVVTNLRQSSTSGSSPSSFSWVFDLNGIAEMYESYEATNLWKIVEDVPRGVHVNFLKAERSLHRWALEDLQRIHTAEELAADEGGGVEMHVLEDAGHWVHADNPDGLFKILSFSFQGF
ncbi:protein ABHD11-like isoform X1 [Camellia sinensis]|uniref:protein ABHD11-like isoform X1 n=1 Tax=Camellia sinensis TaxID=4442 RepID=UPI001035AB88|nr:protein ABHD11-like isoform X1 [Camellia sinensis]